MTTDFRHNNKIIVNFKAGEELFCRNFEINHQIESYFGLTQKGSFHSFSASNLPVEDEKSGIECIMTSVGDSPTSTFPFPPLR